MWLFPHSFAYFLIPFTSCCELIRMLKLTHLINFIIRIYRHDATICSFVGAFLTTYCGIMAVFCNYEIDSLMKVLMQYFLVQNLNESLFPCLLLFLHSLE